MPKIFMVGNDPLVLTQMEERPFESEADLQRLLERYSDLLPGDEVDPDEPRRWLFVGREVGVPGGEGEPDWWSLDHLFLDQDGIPTFVECKRASDTRARREVVAQMLDYAANGTAYWELDRLRQLAAESAKNAKESLEDRIRALTGDEAEVEAYWQKVDANLRAGRVRLMFVADEVPRELRRLVEFLNQQMPNVDVLALEMRQFVADGHRALAPRVVGRVPVKRRPAPARQWDEPRFMEALERHHPGAAATARQLLDWGERNGRYVWWGRGANSGSFFPMLDAGGRSHSFFSVWTSGTVEVQFQMMYVRPPMDAEARRQELARRLNDIPGVSIPADALRRRPSIPLIALADPNAMQQFLSAFEWVASEIQAAT